jgi:hypothetical protein
MTIDIIKEVAEGLVQTIEIDDISVSGQNYTLSVCSTAYITESSEIIIDEESFTVTAMVFNRSVTVVSPTPITASFFTVAAPKFFHGTIKMTNNEVNKLSAGAQVSPMVYLNEPFPERTPEDVQAANQSVADCRLLFLGSCKVDDWLSEDHYQKVVKPMKQLRDLFIDALRNHPAVGRLTGGSNIDHVIAGWNPTEQGKDKSLFKWNMSGCEYRVDVPVLKQSCSC